MKPTGQQIFDDYLGKQEEQFKPCLIKLRDVILSVMSGAEESFSYQAHCFKHVYMLVGIGVTKDFCSLYTMSPPLVKKMKDELKSYKVSGATIHFKPDDPLPEDIIRKIVLTRASDNEALAISRGKK
jgi:uncharacterized protein YdhG (YjbR/CyaY superfamily)